jgi:hypothetical protein
METKVNIVNRSQNVTSTDAFDKAVGAITAAVNL